MYATPPFDRAHEVSDLGELDPRWAGTRVEWMDVAGARVRTLRRDGAPDGPLVLCVHGLGGTAANWVEVMTGLSAIGDVVAVDLPGFGETAPPRSTAPRPTSNARFLATLLHALDRGPAVVLGNSMGGLVATLMAAEHPDLVAQLVLLGPALPPAMGTPPSMEQVKAFAPMVVPVLGPRVMKRRLRRMTFEEQYREMMALINARPERIDEQLIQMGTANLARVKELRWRGWAFSEATAALMDLQIGRARPRVFRAIRAVTAPTLYLRGAQDPLVLHGTTRLVRRLRPDWTIEEPDDLGHVIMLEDPVWMVERVLGFVRGAEVTPLQRA